MAARGSVASVASDIPAWGGIVRRGGGSSSDDDSGGSDGDTNTTVNNPPPVEAVVALDLGTTNSCEQVLLFFFKCVSNCMVNNDTRWLLP